MVRYLIYVSTATRLMDVTELRELLSTCRTQNAGRGVTGALLYRDGTFMQVLEGDQLVVTDVYDRISRDPRHYDVTMIVDGDTAERQFADWWMAFRDLATGPSELADGFSQFLESRGPGSFGPDPTIAQKILLSFRSFIAA